MSLIAVGVGLAATAGSAYLGYSSQQKAIKAQQAGLAGVQGVDIPGVDTLASQTDLQKYQDQFQAQARIDPAYASLRSQGAQGVLGALADFANPNSTVNTSIANAAKAVNTNTPLDQASIQDLITQARQELSLGATLPPEFQAEMVRSGLATGGSVTGNVNGEGATGVGVRTLLGSAGINLQQQRAQEAEGELGTAQSLQQQQENALNELTQLSQNLNVAKAALGSGAAGMGTAALPSIGLTGSQNAQLSVGNTNLTNQKSVDQGNLAAQGALNQGQFLTSLLGGVSGALSGGAGYGASNGWLSNLFTSGGTAQTPSSPAALAGGGIPLNPGYSSNFGSSPTLGQNGVGTTGSILSVLGG
jgi:hypothetical protein